MTITAGARLGPYEIVEWLGAGAMGEVYRARDARLDRDVAIKLIAPSVATDRGRLNRFELEARAAGQISHPNILAVYDVGQHDGAPFIVSELLEGESLRRRLQQGPLPVRKAIEFARQAAEGLAAAHDKQIVHRDVKPDNLFITTDERIKILDFGVAKLIQEAGEAIDREGGQADTVDGVIVGTTAYMSPEQVRGETVDARSDIFSLGAILCEMLTGRAPFARPTQAETLAAVLSEQPPTLPGTIESPAIARVLDRCLEKGREARFQSARDLAFGLSGLADASAVDVPSKRRARFGPGQRALPWTLAGLLALGLALTVFAWAPWRTAVPAPEPMRVKVDLGADAALNDVVVRFGDWATLAPRGDAVAYVAAAGSGNARQLYSGDARQLYYRRLGDLRAEALPWTDGAGSPFFSADGSWIGFFAEGKLKKVATTGGPAVTLADAPNSRGGSWSQDGTIIFSPDRTNGTRLLRVPADASAPQAVTSLVEGEVLHAWPQVLPGGRAVLYTASSVRGAFNDANLVIQTLGGGAPRVVQRGGYHGRYVATGPDSGHLLYVHDGDLMAVAFDVERLEPTGVPARVIEGVATNPTTGGAEFSVSATGLLIYQPGASSNPGGPIHWLERDGGSTLLIPGHSNWFNLAFASASHRLAVEVRDGPPKIALYDLATNGPMNPISRAGGAQKPVWTPDDLRITFASARAEGGVTNLWWQLIDGRSGPEPLTESANAQIPGAWHPSGGFLAFSEIHATTASDLMILRMAGSAESGWKPGTSDVFLNGLESETEPAFSRDGRWLAYEVDSRRPEVYVRPFPGPGPAVRVSTAGGAKPTWSRVKNELFYGNTGQIMVVPYSADTVSFRPQTPRPWSPTNFVPRGASRMFDLHHDGQRFAIAPLPEPDVQSASIVMILNFVDELRRRAPAASQ